MKKKFPPFAILTGISLVAALMLALTNSVTVGPIAVSSAKAADEARMAVLPTAETFETLASESAVDALYRGLSGGATVGYTATVTVAGYGGPVEVTVGIDGNGAITGLNVGGSKFAETAGLGAKAKEPAFTDQFIGKQPPLTLKQDVDAISGATITSAAVTNAVNTAAQAVAAAQ
jgi:Na+-translocating ferredoxin:NAD+ oxidoreductase subunit G